MVAVKESAHLAERLIDADVRRSSASRQQLTIHADRGTPMRSKLVALLFADLGIAASHSRPRVSNDNPFSEAQPHLQVSAGFPKRFGALEHARAICHDLGLVRRPPAQRPQLSHAGRRALRPRAGDPRPAAPPASWRTPRIRSDSSADDHAQKPCRPPYGSIRRRITTRQDAPGPTTGTPDDSQHAVVAPGRAPLDPALHRVDGVESPQRSILNQVGSKTSDTARRVVGEVPLDDGQLKSRQDRFLRLTLQQPE